MICVVCRTETNKYKCPRCFEFYCSVTCCQKHKETECELKQTIQENNYESKEPNVQLPFKTEDTVDTKKLEELSQSEPLKTLLYNPHLRNFLTEIDKAPNAWNAMKLAMQEPLFLEFADECLKIVEPKADAD